MNRKAIGFLGISLLSLASCGLNPPDDYGLDYNTPEFFLARLTPSASTIQLSGSDYKVPDFDSVVRESIFAYDLFEQTDPVKPSTNTYFVYHTGFGMTGLYRSKHGDMYIYLDGTLKIDYWEDMYKKVSFYHKIDKEYATELYDLAKSKIEYAKEVEDEAREKAKEDGNLDKFLESMHSKKSVTTHVLKDNIWGSFSDKGELYSKIKSANHEYLDDKQCPASKLEYNYSSASDWVYHLDFDKRKASIEYKFRDSLGRNLVEWFTYSLSRKDYNAIYDCALSQLSAE